MEIKEYLDPLRRWWWVLVLGVLAATIGSYLVQRDQPPIYQARTTLLVGGALSRLKPDYTEILLAERLANTYAKVLQRSPVRNTVMANLGLESLPPYSVEPIPETQLLEIKVTDTNPALAQAVANELAREMILESPGADTGQNPQRQTFVTEQLDNLEVKIRETQEEIAKSQAELAGLLSARQIADSQAEIAALQSKLATMQANYSVLMLTSGQESVNTLTVVEPAALPTQPIGPNKLRTMVLVGAVGLVLALGTAYLLSYLDDTLKSASDVKRSLGLVVLGAVPRIERRTGQGELVMVPDEHTGAAEAYRMLRANLQFAAVEHPLKLLLVTSAAAEEGKSLTTANLAVALAKAGQRVAVVDADLHRPRMHKVFGLENNRGLTTALLEEAPAMAGVLQATSAPALQVLTSGPLPPNPTELVGSTRMRELLQTLAGQFDMVLVDSPPVLPLADVAVLSAHSDGVLLVIDSGRTRRDAARQAVETLQAVKGRVVGAVLNRVPPGSSEYYYKRSGRYRGAYRSGDGAAEGTAGRRKDV